MVMKAKNILRPLLAALALMLAFSDTPQARRSGQNEAIPETPGLAGQLLVAAPKMRDPRFVETVIFMVEHDSSGAMGLIINREIGHGPLIKILQGIGIKDVDDKGVMVNLHYGGPVQPAYGFILHSPDYQDENTITVTPDVAMSGGDLILRALNERIGPANSLIMLGYAGWGPGQLENEMKRNDWIIIEDPGDLLFDTDVKDKWKKAMSRQTLDL